MGQIARIEVAKGNPETGEAEVRPLSRRRLPPSEELVEAARMQEEDAVVVLVESCEGQIAAALQAAGLWPDSPLYEDARNTALLTIWQELPKFRGESSPCTWMYSITRRVVSSRINGGEVRHRKRLQRLQERTSSSGWSVDQGEEDFAERDLLRRVLVELSEEHREILILRVVLEQSVREVAQTLYLSEGAVKARFHRARRSALAVARRLESDDVR